MTNMLSKSVHLRLKKDLSGVNAEIGELNKLLFENEASDDKAIYEKMKTLIERRKWLEEAMSK